MKKFLSILLALVMIISLSAVTVFGEKESKAEETKEEKAEETKEEKAAEETEVEKVPDWDGTKAEYHIGVVTGTVLRVKMICVVRKN